MREFVLYGFILVISLAGAVITALPILAWARKRAWRKGLMACFASAFEGGMIRGVRYARDRKFVGKGWVDTYRGSAGTLRFTLSVTIEPHQYVKTYWLHLDGGGRDPRTGEPLSQTYPFVADPDKAPDALHVRIHRKLIRLTASPDTWLPPEVS